MAPDEIPNTSAIEWVKAWRGLPLVTSLETRLRVRLQARSALLLSDTNLRYQASALLTQHALAKPGYVLQRADRYRSADYRHANLSKMIAHWAKGIREAKPPSEAGLDALNTLVASWVAKIRERGGDAVFIRLPSSAAVFEAEEELWPRARFWDSFVRSFDSHAIYFSDYPELSDFTAPEGSHLDGVQAAKLSRAFARIVRARGWAR